MVPKSKEDSLHSQSSYLIQKHYEYLSIELDKSFGKEIFALPRLYLLATNREFTAWA